LIAALIAPVGCSFRASDSPAEDAETPSVDAHTYDTPTIDVPPGSGRKKPISIDPTKVTGNQNEFPVWIVLDDPELAASGQLNASDIHFTSPTGTPLPYQITAWNKTSGHLEAWVRLDLDDLAPTVFEIRYGDPATSHAQVPSTVFSNGFSAVWHLDGVAGNGVVAEATGLRLGTAGGGLGPNDRVRGQLGDGLDFDGNVEQIQFANPMTGANPHTISAWVSQRTAFSFDAIMVVGTNATNLSRWFYTHYTTPTLAVGFYGNDWSNVGSNVDNAGFVLVHWVFEGGNRRSRMYRGGAEVGTMVHGNNINTAGTVGYIGYGPVGWGASVGLNGVLDEVRISSMARSAGWIATEFANQKSPSTFYSID
jgi:Concanavalin A-like lectin/glucanases superfamily/Domain of unknown function (DUF2341)